MSFNFILFVIFVLTIIVITKPLGSYIFKVFNNEKTRIDWFARPLQRIYLFILGENIKKEQTARAYFFSLLIFSIIAFFFVFIILLLQGFLPLNPQNISYSQSVEYFTYFFIFACINLILEKNIIVNSQ